MNRSSQQTGGETNLSSGTPKLRLQRDGSVLIITIDRPQVRNALDNETADALARAFRMFDTASDFSVAVLTGAGGHFCAGADLKALALGRVVVFPYQQAS